MSYGASLGDAWRQHGSLLPFRAAVAVFLSLNGYTLVAPDGEPLSTFVEWSITGEISEPAFMKALGQCIVTTEEWEEYLRQKSELPERNCSNSIATTFNCGPGRVPGLTPTRRALPMLPSAAQRYQL
jgi:hypothetical protein